MTDDLLQWAQSSGVGDAGGQDLIPIMVLPTELQLPPEERARNKKVRHRPNKGRKKRTNRNPPLEEPPWDMLRATGYPIPPVIYNLSHPPTNWRRGPKYNLWRIQVHEMWGTVCHLCKHGDARTADHLVPLSKWNNQPYDARLSRPAHGVEGCPTCGIKCNSSRGNRELAIEVGNYQPPISL